MRAVLHSASEDTSQTRRARVEGLAIGLAPSPSMACVVLTGDVEMRALSLIAAGAAALLASLSCAAMPLPESKAAYAGEWIGKDMRLRMDPDGKIAYRRVGRDVNIDVTIELVAFDGDNFSAGVGPLSWTFVVSRPPHAEGSALRMVVDGVELTKSPSSRTQGNDQ